MRVCTNRQRLQYRLVGTVFGEGSCISTILREPVLLGGSGIAKDGQNSAELFRTAREMSGRNQ